MIVFSISEAVHQAPLNVRLASPFGRGGTVLDGDGEGLALSSSLQLQEDADCKLNDLNIPLSPQREQLPSDVQHSVYRKFGFYR